MLPRSVFCGFCSKDGLTGEAAPYSPNMTELPPSPVSELCALSLSLKRFQLFQHISGKEGALRSSATSLRL